MDVQERAKIANQVGIRTIIANILLFLVKLVAGVIGRSGAMVADAFHSLSDMVSTIAVMIGLHMAKKPADDDHPYGHEKIEPIVAKILAIILVITAIGIGYNGIKELIINDYQVPGLVALYAAVISILAKEWMYRYTVKAANKIESFALAADAWHHRSDAFTSIGTLIAIIGARLGFTFLDSVASIIIAVLIMKVAIDIYLDSVKQLIDFAGDEEVIAEIKGLILGVEGVMKVNNLQTRMHATKMYVDVAVAVNCQLTVTESHAIARKVHDEIEDNFQKVKHCMVHVDPYT